jgi:predicted alpha/beta-fold hydrolase
VFSGLQDFDIEKVLATENFHFFEKEFTRKIHGLTDTDQYYREKSSKYFMEHVKIPLMMLNALDDPIIHHSGIDYESWKRNDNLILLTTQRGGHGSYMTTGFAGVVPDFSKSWLEEFLVSFVRVSEKWFNETKKK